MSTYGAKARKSLNRVSWDWFSRLLEPRPGSHQIEFLEIRFLDVLSHGWTVIQSSLLGLVLLTSGAKAKESSNRSSWDWFCRLLEPRPESYQIELLGTGFLIFWSQGQKVIKSSVSGFDFWSQGQKIIKSSFHVRDVYFLIGMCIITQSNVFSI